MTTEIKKRKNLGKNNVLSNELYDKLTSWQAFPVKDSTRWKKHHGLGYPHLSSMLRDTWNEEHRLLYLRALMWRSIFLLTQGLQLKAMIAVIYDIHFSVPGRFTVAK
jgi:hypothetical protein